MTNRLLVALAAVSTLAFVAPASAQSAAEDARFPRGAGSLRA